MFIIIETIWRGRSEYERGLWLKRLRKLDLIRSFIDIHVSNYNDTVLSCSTCALIACIAHIVQFLTKCKTFLRVINKTYTIINRMYIMLHLTQTSLLAKTLDLIF